MALADPKDYESPTVNSLDAPALPEISDPEPDPRAQVPSTPLPLSRRPPARRITSPFLGERLSPQPQPKICFLGPF